MHSFKLAPLADLIENLAEDRVNSILSSYSCPINAEIEDFLHNKAVDFSNASIARTYLLFTESNMALAGFFTIAPKSFILRNISQLSKTLARKLNKFSEHNEELSIQILNVFLVAQLGKNFTPECSKLITGAQLLNIAINRIAQIQRELGGKIVCVECEDKIKLVSFYEANGFVVIQKRKNPQAAYSINQSDYLVQLAKYL